ASPPRPPAPTQANPPPAQLLEGYGGHGPRAPWRGRRRRRRRRRRHRRRRALERGGRRPLHRPALRPSRPSPARHRERAHARGRARGPPPGPHALVARRAPRPPRQPPLLRRPRPQGNPPPPPRRPPRANPGNHGTPATPAPGGGEDRVRGSSSQPLSSVIKRGIPDAVGGVGGGAALAPPDQFGRDAPSAPRHP